jgi:GDPmannose 4,6-dehydratase
MRRALITGITGQDGRFLGEFLTGKGYQVFGLVRGQNNPKAQLVQDENPSLELISGDLQDLSSLIAVVEQVQPDEVYNLGAVSFVKLSFQQPELTADITGLGVLRMLEAIRVVGGTQGNPVRFYQASSSEMFGKVRETPQNEQTPFHPRSPYGVAKVFGHYMTMNYREAYGLHASSGMLFNHECVPGETPVIVRENGYIDILPIRELVSHDESVARDNTHHQREGNGLEVWDGDRFTPCTARSANWRADELVTIHARGGVVETTPDHVVFIGDGEKPSADVCAGEALHLGDQPYQVFNTVLTGDEAWLLGILAAEGYVSPDGAARVTCSDESVLARSAECWERVTGGRSRKWDGAPSGFSDRRIPAVELQGARPYGRQLRHELYTADGKKRVPKRILNANPIIQEHFLSAYTLGDGLRAGHGIGEFKSLRTTSPTLAAGLVWMARTGLGRRVSFSLQPRALGGGSSYLINLSSGLTVSNKGAHLRKPQDEVRKVERRAFTGWTYDLATESGRFAAGVGGVVIHNSPRRGMEFYSRKVTNALARIKLGLQDSITLGNLDFSRDWGFAGDYVEAMWLMLQQPEPGDYVIATGETHTGREFLEAAFRTAGIDDWTPYVNQDQRFMRPAEVDLLIGDADKARKVLGWEPRVDFDGLVKLMYESDLAEERARAETGKR